MILEIICQNTIHSRTNFVTKKISSSLFLSLIHAKFRAKKKKYINNIGFSNKFNDFYKFRFFGFKREREKYLFFLIEKRKRNKE